MTLETLTYSDFLRLYPSCNDLLDSTHALNDTQNIINHVALVHNVDIETAANMDISSYLDTKWVYQLCDSAMFLEGLEKPQTLQVGNITFELSKVTDLRQFNMTNIQFQAIENVLRSLNNNLLQASGIMPTLIKTINSSKPYNEVLNDAEKYNFERYLSDLAVGRKTNLHKIIAPILQPFYDNINKNVVYLGIDKAPKFDYDKFEKSEINNALLQSNALQIIGLGFFLLICMKDIYLTFIHASRAKDLAALRMMPFLKQGNETN